MNSFLRTTAAIVLTSGLVIYATGHAGWLHSDNEVVGNGQVTTAKRHVPQFDSLSSHGSFHVVVKANNTPGLTVTADSNLLPYIVTKVEDGVLVIKVQRDASISTNNEIDVNVNAKQLKQVENYGSGKIQLDGQNGITEIDSHGSGGFYGQNIQTDDLKVNSHGSGSLSLVGKINIKHINNNGNATVTINGINTKDLDINNYGSGSINVTGVATDVDVKNLGSGKVFADGLKAKEADVKLMGSGSVNVYASNALDVKLMGSGNLNVTGHPATVNKEVFGRGNITIQ